MKVIILTVLTACLFASTAVTAQNKNDDSQKPQRNFRKFRIDFGGGGMRFIGEKEPEVKYSKTGTGVNIQPAWNLTDNHSLGFKIVYSEHNEKNGTEHFSFMANYMYTYYGGPNDVPDREERVIGLFGGLGIGISNGPEHNNDSIGKTPSKTSFAVMPFLGIRYSHLNLDGHYHLAAGNKQNTYVGFSAGVIFGGGLLHDPSKKHKHKS